MESRQSRLTLLLIRVEKERPNRSRWHKSGAARGRGAAEKWAAQCIDRRDPLATPKGPKRRSYGDHGHGSGAPAGIFEGPAPNQAGAQRPGPISRPTGRSSNAGKTWYSALP